MLQMYVDRDQFAALQILDFANFQDSLKLFPESVQTAQVQDFSHLFFRDSFLSFEVDAPGLPPFLLFVSSISYHL